MNGCICKQVGLAAIGLLSCIVGSPARAQDSAPAGAERLEISVTPYVWATALKGDVGVGRTSADVDASFSDILDVLNVGLMGSFQARRDR